jgi:TM2 domain-containing membrane protein YozV
MVGNLRPCPHCGNRVSMTAERCPQCGGRVRPKSRAIYVLLALLLGGLFGLHNFYARRWVEGVIQLILTLVTGWLIVPLFIVVIWVLRDCVQIKTDGDGMPFA